MKSNGPFIGTWCYNLCYNGTEYKLISPVIGMETFVILSKSLTLNK
jgi:hypothetical protein